MLDFTSRNHSVRTPVEKIYLETGISPFKIRGNCQNLILKTQYPGNFIGLFQAEPLKGKPQPGLKTWSAKGFKFFLRIAFGYCPDTGGHEFKIKTQIFVKKPVLPEFSVA